MRWRTSTRAPRPQTRWCSLSCFPRATEPDAPAWANTREAHQKHRCAHPPPFHTLTSIYSSSRGVWAPQGLSIHLYQQLPKPISLKWEKNHDIFVTMLTLMMEKQPFVEFIHSPLKNPTISWIKKTVLFDKDWKLPHPSVLFFFLFRVAPHYRNTLFITTLSICGGNCSAQLPQNEIQSHSLNPSEGTSVDIHVPINTRIRAWLHVMQSFAFEDYLCALWKMRPAMLHCGPLCLFLLLFLIKNSCHVWNLRTSEFMIALDTLF